MLFIKWYIQKYPLGQYASIYKTANTTGKIMLLDAYISYKDTLSVIIQYRIHTANMFFKTSETFPQKRWVFLLVLLGFGLGFLFCFLRCCLLLETLGFVQEGWESKDKSELTSPLCFRPRQTCRTNTVNWLFTGTWE